MNDLTTMPPAADALGLTADEVETAVRNIAILQKALNLPLADALTLLTEAAELVEVGFRYGQRSMAGV